MTAQEFLSGVNISYTLLLIAIILLAILVTLWNKEDSKKRSR